MLVPSALVDTAAVLLEVGRSGTESQALAGLASDAFQRSYVLLFLLWSAYPQPEKEKRDLALQEAGKVRAAGGSNILWDLMKGNKISPLTGYGEESECRHA